MPSSSTASLVIEEVTIWPLPISTRTCEVVAPFFTSTTVPLIWLRALMRMVDPSVFSEHDASAKRRSGGDDREWMRSVALIRSLARAYGATMTDIIAFSSEVDTRLARQNQTYRVLCSNQTTLRLVIAWRPARPAPGGN